MKTFKEFVTEEQKYTDSGIDVGSIRSKIKHHDSQSTQLSKELSKHNKTSDEYRSLKNDITHHDNARNSYSEAHYRIKMKSGPSYVKEKIKSAEKHASKVSGIIPKVKESAPKIKNIHDHVHKILTDSGFSHTSEDSIEHTQSTKRMTPYGDDRAFTQRGKRVNTTHSYTKKGDSHAAKRVEETLRKNNVLGLRNRHDVGVRHTKGIITVTHHITGTSSPDHSYNEREYNYASGAGSDPVHWGTRYHSWRKNY